MLNFYSCGCTADGDIPVLSRCGEHNGYVVAAVRDKVLKRASFRVDDLRIRHHPLKETLATIREKKIKFDLICSYPEHAHLYAYNSMDEGWRLRVNPQLGELYDSLTNDGHLVFVVEQTLLARVIYDCLMHGFCMNSVSVVSSIIAYEPLHEKWPEFYVYKFAVLFSKSGTDAKLPSYMRLSKLHLRLKKKFRPRRVLETSCIHTPFLHIAPKTIGVCEDYNRYSKLKRELCKK